MFIEIENEYGHRELINTDYIIRVNLSDNKVTIIMPYEGSEEQIIVGNMTFDKLSSLLRKA